MTKCKFWIKVFFKTIFLIFIITLPFSSTIMISSKFKPNIFKEIRICPKEDIDIRVCASDSCKKDKKLKLDIGTELYVLEEKDGWIRFKQKPRENEESYWVKKDSTVPLDQWKPDKNKKILSISKIEKLKIYQICMNSEESIRTNYRSLLVILEMAMLTMFFAVIVLRENTKSLHLWAFPCVGIILCIIFLIACEYRGLIK